MSRRRDIWLAQARRNLAEYDLIATPDPARTIHVNPLSITHVAQVHAVTKARLGTKLPDFGRILDGDDDLRHGGQPNPPFSGNPAYRSVRQRFVEGRRWEDTDVFAQRLAALEENGKVDGCRTRQELEERYRQLDDVVEDIRNRGYCIDRIAKFNSNIFVTIDRYGRFLLAQGGNHRLAVVQLFGLPSIEVYVFARHRLWQDVRDLAFAGRVEWCHPDLVEFGAVEVVGGHLRRATRLSHVLT